MNETLCDACGNQDPRLIEGMCKQCDDKYFDDEREAQRLGAVIRAAGLVH